jgi:hypothetical protein
MPCLTNEIGISRLSARSEPQLASDMGFALGYQDLQLTSVRDPRREHWEAWRAASNALCRFVKGKKCWVRIAATRKVQGTRGQSRRRPAKSARREGRGCNGQRFQVA